MEGALPPSRSSPPDVVFLVAFPSPCAEWKSPSPPRSPGVTKHMFLFPTPGRPGEQSKLTSVVMDEAEFEALLQHIAEGDPVMNVMSGQRMSPVDVDALRRAKTVPLISRGTKTEYLFKIYEVETDYFSAIVRGQGERVLSKLVDN